MKYPAWFERDAAAYAAQALLGPFPLTSPSAEFYPCLDDRVGHAARVDPHYFFQDIWAARRVWDHWAAWEYEDVPKQHVDVGSSVAGFVAHLLAMRVPVTYVDIRPLGLHVDGLTCLRTDATTLEGIADASVHSLSCLHALEHFGLGRYGDTVDAEAPWRAMDAFARVLATGGRLYFSVPVGRQRVVFNAHRVFAPGTVRRGFEQRGLKMVDFSIVRQEHGALEEDVGFLELLDEDYACGLFEFVKEAP